MNLTDRFIDCIESFINNDDFSEDAIKKCFFDYTGVLISGAYKLKGRHENYIKHLASSGDAIVAGTSKTTDVYSSALLNALSAHVLELDDGHRYGMLHPGVTIFSALLAVCRKDKVKPHDFFRAAAAGYEATIRLACMVQPEHKKKGFHASATCGTIGAAVAVSVSRNYSRIELKNAISAATTSASGLLEMIDDDSELKPYNCAQAAVNGIMAANMAKVGYKGPKDAIGGKRGFICAFNGTINLQKIESALVMENCVNSIYRKLYASCRHTHSAVEAALMLRTEYDIALNDIKEIIVATYDLAVYGHDNTEVHSISAAKMSTPYSVATALIYGKSGLDAFTEKMLADSLVRALTQKVKVISKSAFTCLVPKIRAAEVTIELINGDKYKSRVNYPKGEPENPLSNEEMEKKFTELLTAANMEGEYITKLQNSIVELHNNWNTYFELITC